MESAVIAVKLKCGSTLASMTWTSFARLPPWISLSLVIRSTTSSVTFLTSTSGASCAGAAPAKASAPITSRALVRLLVVALIFRFLLPWRRPIVDQAAAALKIGIALEYIFVERRLLEDAARIEEIGPRLREPQDDQAPARIERTGLVDRVGVEIQPLADAVAHRARAEDGQDEVGAGAE